MKRTLLLATISVWVSACDSTSSQVTYVRPTYLQVNPDKFPSPPQCVDADEPSSEGYLSYVATLVDVSSEDAAVGYLGYKEQAASPALSCSGALRFGTPQVELDHKYMLWVDAYPFAAERLIAQTPGARQMLLDGNGVEPSFRFACNAEGVARVEFSTDSTASDPIAPAPATDAGTANSADDASSNPMDAAVQRAGDAAASSDAAKEPSNDAPDPITATPLSPLSGQTLPFRGCALAQLVE